MVSRQEASHTCKASVLLEATTIYAIKEANIDLSLSWRQFESKIYFAPLLLYFPAFLPYGVLGFWGFGVLHFFEFSFNLVGV